MNKMKRMKNSITVVAVSCESVDEANNFSLCQVVCRMPLL